MNPELRDFLNLRHPPARLNAGQAAALLGFQEHDIPLLVRADLLKPLNRVRRRDGDRRGENTVKMFALVQVLEHRQDAAWLARATRALNDHWSRKRRGGGGETLPLAA
jgi:hypothetical protein